MIATITSSHTTCHAQYCYNSSEFLCVLVFACGIRSNAGRLDKGTQLIMPHGMPCLLLLLAVLLCTLFAVVSAVLRAVAQPCLFVSAGCFVPRGCMGLFLLSCCITCPALFAFQAPWLEMG